jgi:RNA polymerase sigma-70 factor (ECF subfamily)
MDFESLFDEYYDKVYVYIYRRVNNPADAEDLTADVFLKAFTNPYDARLGKFSSYIFTIAANILKNHYRAVAKQATIFAPSKLDENLPCDTDIPCELITREEYAELRGAIATLPERQYNVVYRRYYLEQSFKEIGAAMSLSETNARQVHFAAIKKLRRLLKNPNEIETCVYKQVGGGDERN